jgi:raffinose/stachyose/melibiose transport system permease protein
MTQRRDRRQKIVARVLGVLGFCFLALWVLMTVAPLIISVLSSVKSQTDITARPFAWPQEFLFSNYSRAWTGGSWGEPWYRFAINSVVAAGTGIVVGIGAGVLAGYAVVRSETRLGGILNRYFVLLITLPFVVTWVPLFALSDRLGVLSNPFALGLMYAARLIPFAAVMMRAYFSSFPLDLIESAHVDGASELKTFRRVVLPLSWGGIIAVGLIQFIFLWNELGLAQILLLDPSSRTLPPGLSQFRGQFSIDFGAMYASLVLTVVPIIVLYSIAQKKLTEGLRVGAMK